MNTILPKVLLITSLLKGLVVLTQDTNIQKGFYDFKVLDINGNLVNLQKYSGRIGLIVNVASFCGYTKSEYHYFQLTECVWA